MTLTKNTPLPSDTAAPAKTFMPSIDQQGPTEYQPLADASQVVVNVPSNVPQEGYADILNGVASVLWPLVVILIAVMYRDQIVSLARRIRKGNFLGAEAEFEKDLETLSQEATKAKEETNAGMEIPPLQPASGTKISETKDIRDEVLDEASRSPRLGLMMLSAEIDKLARRIAASTGHSEKSTLRDQMELWRMQLPTHTAQAYRLFSHVRNRIIHGADASEQEVLSAIDSGLKLYDAFKSIPIEINVVAHPSVDIFSDERATQLSEGKGLIIETTNEEAVTFRIFPTTKSYYVVGMRLTWEWNMNRVWSETWYRDPDNGEIKQAWAASAEFVGRDLDQI